MDDIEDLLTRYRPAGPRPGLRARVMNQARRQSRGAFLEALAAMLLVGITLGQASVWATRLLPEPRPDERRTQQLASAVIGLDLGLPPEDAHAMARRLAAGERLVPLSVIRGTANPREGALR